MPFFQRRRRHHQDSPHPRHNWIGSSNTVELKWLKSQSYLIRIVVVSLQYDMYMCQRLVRPLIQYYERGYNEMQEFHGRLGFEIFRKPKAKDRWDPSNTDSAVSLIIKRYIKDKGEQEKSTENYIRDAYSTVGIEKSE